MIVCGDCLEVMKTMPGGSVDLVVTSPPYADARKKTYGGVSPDEYAGWFLPRSEQILRVLKEDGTFILNIKEKVVDGERHTYVIDLVKELKGQGWLWTEEFIWSKTNCSPGKWPSRFRDSWEHLYQFNKSKKFKMYQEAVMVPVGDWHVKRLEKLSDNDKKRCNSNTRSGFGSNKSKWVGRDKVYPSNVLTCSTVCNNKSHSAAFPEFIPEWFIKLFTAEGDCVLDPFCGSGTTVKVAERLGRKGLGIDVIQFSTES